MKEIKTNTIPWKPILIIIVAIGFFSILASCSKPDVISFLIEQREVIAKEYRTAKQELDQAQKKFEETAKQNKAIKDLLIDFENGKDVTIKTAKKVYMRII